MRRLTVRDAPDCAQLHAQCFDRPWSHKSFVDILGDPKTFGFGLESEGYVICRSVLDEAELLTICTATHKRRTGLAYRLIGAAIADCQELNVRRFFLEVAETNIAARALYLKMGFVETGMRPNYYGREAAILMEFDCA